MKESFLYQTAESIVQQIDWQQLSQTTLVLPSHRAGLVLKNELLRLQQERRQQAVWAPEVKTLQQLQSELSPLYEEDELLTVVRLYRHYRRLNDGDADLMPLDMFYGWGKQMLADFTNIDASMHANEVPNFFDNTIAAHELGQLGLDDEVIERLRALIKPYSDEKEQQLSDSIRNQYKKIWQQLDLLYNALHQEMLNEHKGYSGMRQRAIIERWDEESIQAQIRGRKYVFVGFNYLLPVECELMQLLSKQALFYWDYVTNFQANEKAFHFAQLNSGKLGSVLPARQWNTPREVTVMACISRESQAQYVHNWLLDNYKEKGQKVGVVICDETMLESVIYALPAIQLNGEKESAPINITKGFPLRNTHIYARVLAWLYDSARGDAEQEVSPDFIEQLLASFFPVTDNPSTATENSSPLAWKELLILESEYQVRKIANQLRLVIAKGLGDVPFTLKLLRLLMRRTMESVTMPFHGEPVTDIQVMGVLETRMLDFDKLLIINVEEGVLPQKQLDLSFIPFYLRKAYHMQTSDERATVYAYNFFRLLSRAGQSTLLFTTADGAENSKGMSRFIMQILVSPQEFNVTKRYLNEPSVLEIIDDERLQTEGSSFTALSLSPSALNTYISCPRKFCLQYIKHIRVTKKEEGQFGPATLGSFVHYMMQYLYEDHLKCNGKLTTISPESIEQILADEQLLDTALNYAYEKMNKEWQDDHPTETNHFIPDQHRPERTVIMEFVRNILERDKQDAREKGLTIVALEKDCRFYIDLGELGKIRSGGRVDRIDILGDEKTGTMRVVDYKSGTYHEGPFDAKQEEWMKSKDVGYIRQTLIYSQAVKDELKRENPIEPNLFFCSRSLVNQKTTIAVDGKEIHNYEADIKNDFITALTDKVQEIKTITTFPPCAPKDCDPYCPFISLCRRKVYRYE